MTAGEISQELNVKKRRDRQNKQHKSLKSPVINAEKAKCCEGCVLNKNKYTR